MELPDLDAGGIVFDGCEGSGVERDQLPIAPLGHPQVKNRMEADVVGMLLLYLAEPRIKVRGS